jgi:hypothetical protein
MATTDEQRAALADVHRLAAARKLRGVVVDAAGTPEWIGTDTPARIGTDAAPATRKHHPRVERVPVYSDSGRISAAVASVGLCAAAAGCLALSAVAELPRDAFVRVRNRIAGRPSHPTPDFVGVALARFVGRRAWRRAYGHQRLRGRVRGVRVPSRDARMHGRRRTSMILRVLSLSCWCTVQYVVRVTLVTQHAAEVHHRL